MTDKTPVCIYSWEKPILEQVHGGGVEEVTIEQMCDMKDAVKVEKAKIARAMPSGEKADSAMSLRAQLEAMAEVDPENDPADDPAAEYSRLVDKYGMDKEIPLPVVTRVYGEFNSGAFAAALKAAALEGKPARAPEGKPVEKMGINEIRSALRDAGIEFDQTAGKAELADLLVTATA